jgi:hypothetical protein
MYIYAGYKYFVRDNWEKQVAFNVAGVESFARTIQVTTLNVRLDVVQLQRFLIGFKLLGHYTSQRAEAHAALARSEGVVHEAEAAAAVGEA